MIVAQVRAAALIGFALFGPAGLPAGGAEWRLPELRRRQSSDEPLTAPALTALRSSPQHQAPVIVQAGSGQPLRVLRRWCSSGGDRWLQVELPAPIVAAAAMRGPRRGWLLEAEV